MKRRHLAALAGRLYPRTWRRRYGEELADLCEEYLLEGESTPVRLALGLSMSALGERARAATSTSRRRQLIASVVLVVVVASTGATTNAFGLLDGRRAEPTQAASAAAPSFQPRTRPYTVILSCNPKAFKVDGLTISVVAPMPGRLFLPKAGQPVALRVPNCTVSVRAR